ncbi:MAG: hypothetical protein K2H45_03345 [Acetatifactor sp.]|nr:hypothetical protein [Acetatifactor sp.]
MATEYPLCLVIYVIKYMGLTISVYNNVMFCSVFKERIVYILKTSLLKNGI